MKRISPETKKLLAPFFPTLNLDRIRLYTKGLRLGYLILLLNRANAITFSKKIFFARGMLDESTITGITLIAHELTHVRQYQETGFLRFLYRYLRDYIQSRIEGKDHHSAYLNVSFEREAFTHEREIYEKLKIMVENKES
ncbi:MAG: DUF4157 domain-containing protein [Deltaproteobacteria bacterium]|nr:MAG: DUF4157 domain-containing protein [Deltaproteobacteria bacterium]